MTMNFVPASSASGRAVFHFTVAGMSVREELLLRSMVRVLDHLTQHEWSCKEGKPHLAIVQPGANTDPKNLSVADETMAVLMVGDAVADAELTLRLPLHPVDLEMALNKAGATILRKMSEAAVPAGDTVKPLQAEPPRIADNAKQGFPEVTHDLNEPLQLSRWPPTSLLSSLQHVKAATLLLKAPISMEKIRMHSGLTEDQCLRFVGQLRQQMLLQQPEAVSKKALPAAVAAAEPRLGLFARIRAKLGLQP